MLLLVGLGNPGAGYARQRHNLGFMAVDAVAQAHRFGPWRAKFSSLISEGQLGEVKVLLLKPQTFMNLSGYAVAHAARFFKLSPAQIVVCHDEVDLVAGKVRIKTGGGVAGHNGLRSIAEQLGSRDFRRVRFGVGHPGHKDRVTGHVLGNYAKAEMDDLADMLGAIAGEADWLAKGEDVRFMSEFALRLQD